MSQLSLDLPAARAAANAGMAQAGEHADEEVPSWTDVALGYLRQFARHHAEFMTEDARVHAEQAGLVVPPTKRAWGVVTRKALRQGIIASTGTHRPQRSTTCHGSPKPVWRSLVLVRR